jgi:hypothetical protein
MTQVVLTTLTTIRRYSTCSSKDTEGWEVPLPVVLEGVGTTVTEEDAPVQEEDQPTDFTDRNSIQRSSVITVTV